MFKYGDTLDFYEKCNKPNIPRKSDFNFMKFELARVVYLIKNTIEGVYYGDTLVFRVKTQNLNIPRESDFNFIKFELARVVYPIKKYHLGCLKLISNAGFPGNLNFEIPTESDQTILFIGFRMVDLVGNRFLILKILKHKKGIANLNSGIEPNYYLYYMTHMI